MKFKPEDFYVCDEVVDGNKCTREHEISLSDKECADLANARLEQMLSEAPVVYADKRHAEIQNVWVPSKPGNTHTARLVDIKEIK